MSDLPPYTHTPVTTADGTPVIGWWPTEPAKPKCKCSHKQHRGQCYSTACGCRENRPQEEAS